MATHLAVLPQDLLALISGGADALQRPSLHFLRLPHPRTNMPCLFLPYIQASASSILEVQAVNPEAHRSWFLEGDEIVSDGKLLLLNPIDPVFLLVPVLAAAQPDDGSIGLFRPKDDIFEIAATHLVITEDSVDAGCPPTPNPDVLCLQRIPCVEAALKSICDYKEVTEDLTVYRYSQAKLLAYCRAKVERLSSQNVIERFSVLRRSLAKDGLSDAKEGQENLVNMARTKLACDLMSQYLPTGIARELAGSFDLTDLHCYLAALREEDMEVTPAPKQTPQPAGDSKKRKAAVQASNGVKKLQKVNTTGMAKLSTFFKKK